MALDKSTLKDKIKEAVEESFKPALEVSLKKLMPTESTASDEAAKTFAETFVDICAEPFAEYLSSAIDYYIRTADIHGQMQIFGIQTVGGMTAQTQVVPLTVTAATYPVGQGGGTLPLINQFYLGIK